MSNGHKVAALSFSVALALAGVVALLWLLGGGTPSAHADSPHRVAPNCTGIPPPCHTTIQAAVDAASPGDVIKVAAGVYTDVHGLLAPAGYPNPPASGIITQVVYISKTITIQGGYTTTNWTTPYPITQPTTLDAQGQGRVILIAGDPSTSPGQAISPTIEGLRITGGDANKLGGDPRGGVDTGGGVYIISATATISNNRVFSNTSDDLGGGLALYYSDATVSESIVSDNNSAQGGGLALWSSDAMLNGNTVYSNKAAIEGGGLFLHISDATLSANAIMSNTAVRGGGLYIRGSDNATLSENTIYSNKAVEGGGGLFLRFSDATLSRNTIYSNKAIEIGAGGLYIQGSDNATLSGNIVISNTADCCGGLWLSSSAATLDSNIVTANTATYCGGGLCLASSAATLSSNIITANAATYCGGGLLLSDSNAIMKHRRHRQSGRHRWQCAVHRGLLASPIAYHHRS